MFLEVEGEGGPAPAALGEAGPLGWARRFFTGVDRGDAPALDAEISRGIRTQAHKRQMLEHIDRLVRAARRAEDGSMASDASGPAAAGLAALAVPAFVFAGPAGAPLAAAAGGAAAARAILTGANRRRGEIRRYVEALLEVRRRVEAAEPERRGLGEELLPPPGAGPLAEGLGALAKGLAVGDIEGEVRSLAAEVGDVHSPAAQAMVLRKVLLLMRRLTILRHGGAGLRKFVHDSAAWFERKVEGRNAVVEIDIRAGEALRELARVRDRLMAKRFGAAAGGGEAAEEAEREERMRRAAAEAVARPPAPAEEEF